MRSVPDVHPWPKEAFSSKEAISSREHLAGASLSISLMGCRHVHPTCERELQTEQDIPAGDLSRDDSV